jgi:hypothetical protein
MYTKSSSSVFLIIIAVFGSIIFCFSSTIMISNATSESPIEVYRLPSEPTDYPSNDNSTLEVLFVNVIKNSIDDYHVIGSIKNVGSETLNYVKVTAHFFDEDLNPIGITTCCYADPSDIEPQHTSAFDSFSSSDEIIGEPRYFRLSFDWD